MLSTSVSVTHNLTWFISSQPSRNSLRPNCWRGYGHTSFTRKTTVIVGRLNTSSPTRRFLWRTPPKRLLRDERNEVSPTHPCPSLPTNPTSSSPVVCMPFLGGASGKEGVRGTSGEVGGRFSFFKNSPKTGFFLSRVYSLRRFCTCRSHGHFNVPTARHAEPPFL